MLTAHKKDQPNQIVWFFGQSAAGKRTVINEISENKEQGAVLGQLNINDDCEVRVCYQSLYWTGHERTKLVHLIPTLVESASNLTLLVKGQTVDLDSDMRIVCRVKERLPGLYHRIVFVWCTPDEVLRRWTCTRELTRSGEQCLGELKQQLASIKKLEANFEIICLDATSREYRLISWPPDICWQLQPFAKERQPMSHRGLAQTFLGLRWANTGTVLISLRLNFVEKSERWNATYELGGTGMRRLVFIDDDKTELEAFRDIVGGDYDYTTVHWPDESRKLFSIPSPNIFVSDLYLPPLSGEATPTAAERDAAARAAKQVAKRFSRLYAHPSRDDKARLRETMKAIAGAYDLLKLQWKALRQSPDHGVALLKNLRKHCPEVPFVFYSRKITPEDVIRVLQAGAVDAIQKGALKKKNVLTRLRTVQEIWRRKNVRIMRRYGLSTNITVFSRA